jgi:hypothetical protein
MLVVACGPVPVVTGADAGLDAGVDAGMPPYEPPVVKSPRSLFWNDAVLLDDPSTLSFKQLMATIAPDGHGGALLDDWFRSYRFSSRAAPEQLMYDVAAAQGADPTKWDRARIACKVTGVHNRLDLAQYGAGGHCGELRVSVVSTELGLQDFHMLFIFSQPREPDDDGCVRVARRWAELSRLEGAELHAAVRALWREGLTRERFALIETVELSTQPWEWRQWVKGPASGALPFTLVNPPLFQQVDVEGLNSAGPRRDAFLAWVADNAARLDARMMLIEERFRAPTVQVVDGVPRKPLSLTGLEADVAAQYPNLRKNIELVGCAACHTTGADFVQTRPNRTVSPFYERELVARERHLEKMARGERPSVPFGPLQSDPLLPD